MFIFLNKWVFNQNFSSKINQSSVVNPHEYISMIVTTVDGYASFVCGNANDSTDVGLFIMEYIGPSFYINDTTNAWNGLYGGAREQWGLARQYPYLVASILFYYYIENINDFPDNESITPKVQTFIKDLGDNYFTTAYNYYAGDSLRFTPESADTADLLCELINQTNYACHSAELNFTENMLNFVQDI